MTCELIRDRQKASSTWLAAGSQPTLVLDAGMGNWSLFFYPLVKVLRTFADICLINRDGYLDSGSHAPNDLVSVAHQMKTVLNSTQIQGPMILVGHSLGGLHVRMFQHLFPEKVAGLVLLDAAHPRLYEGLPHVKPNILKQIRLVEILNVMARLQLLKYAKSKIPTFGLPPTLYDSYYKVTTTARYYRTYQSEMRYFESNLERGKMLGGLGDLPLLVVSSPYGLNHPINETNMPGRNEDKAWLGLQRDLLTLSTQSIFILSKGDHFMHLTDTKFVAKAIQSFCEMVSLTHKLR